MNGAAKKRLVITEERDAKLAAAAETQALADATSKYNDLKTLIEDYTADLKLFEADASNAQYQKPKTNQP